ncbi:hypothetical protein [Candidatus Poriferisodalis sp.]|uniref:hypothetical protein n=1 Tax=Candidatus Poriferisodalis sp. TaxID=3101277 RepID=UPI003AF48C6D
MEAEVGTERYWRTPPLAAFCLLALMVGCSTTPLAPSADAAPHSLPSLLAGDTTSSTANAALHTGDAATQYAGPDDTQRHMQLVPSRTADAAGPFGEPDTWLGASPPPTGLQRRLERGDRPGPLMATSSPGYALQPVGNTYRLTDRCERLDLLVVWQAGGPSAVMPYFRYSAWTRRPLEEAVTDCTWRRYLAEAEGVDYYGIEGRYFRDRSRAEEWLRELEREAERSRLLPYDAAEMGFLSSDHAHPERLGGIWFAPWDAPLDEVRVLVETIAVRDGVLRGLMRNWSRHLWAYGLTVSAGGREFVWPLSVQPGEIAPFEIHGWDGPTDPDLIELSVLAEMSWHADLSRAFHRYGSDVESVRSSV